MQLRAARTSGLAAGLAALLLLAVPEAHAEDQVDFTTTWYQEQRQGGEGGLTVVHPQLDIGVDAGETTTLNLGYSADVVSGATASVFSTDAITSATTFEDIRHEGRLSLGFAGSRSSLAFSAGVGTERDYTSISVGAGGAVDLPGKNTNLALSYTHNFDQVCDRENAMLTTLERQPLTGDDPCEKSRLVRGQDTPGMTVWRALSIDTAQSTLTQNLSPTLVMQVSLFGQVLRGFQSNPYRRVQIGNILPQESVPDVRGRAALSARINRFLPGVRGAVHASLRGYSDTWGVDAITGEMGYSQYAGSSLLLQLRARFHQQAAAVFYKDAYYLDVESTAGAYATGDRELGRLRNILGGVKMAYIKAATDGGQVWGVFDRLQLNLKADVLLLDELPANDSTTNPEGIDGQFLTSGQLLDAVVLQVGLLLRY